MYAVLCSAGIDVSAASTGVITVSVSWNPTEFVAIASLIVNFIGVKFCFEVDWSAG